MPRGARARRRYRRGVQTTEQRTSFNCPRCGAAADERFYGPCTPCRGDLAATVGGRARDVERAQFEPRANVVANHVATKD